jgi:hypothetical protein
MPKNPAMLGHSFREARILELQTERSAMTGVNPTVNQLVVLAVDARHGDCCAGHFCNACDSHVSTYDAGEVLLRLRPESAFEDWWVACDNGACVHAYGDGLFQVLPNWIVDRQQDKTVG